MRFGSVCSGIEAASAAWLPLGWECAFMSEIEAFPRAVLKHHYPEAPLHGDFTTISGDEYGPVDLLVGGTPCQAFSVAGLRGGLSDARGNLALEFLKLADRLRPRWIVWENVPGVFSATSHAAPDPCDPPDLVGGEARRGLGETWVDEAEYDADEDHALACFLAGLSELGYWWAYRVLDAQYFGVPQRRRRIFVVGYPGDWRPPAAVLFERASLSGDPPPRRGAGQGAAHDVAPSLVSSGRGVERAGETRGQDPVVAQAFGGNNTAGPIDVATAVTAHGGPHGRLDFESETFVASPITASYAKHGGAAAGKESVPHNLVIAPIPHVDVLPTMQNGADTPAGHSARSGNTKDSYVVPMAFALRGREGGAVPEVEGDGDQAGALRAADGGSSRDYVAYAPEVSATMAARSSRGGGQTNSPGHNADQQVVVQDVAAWTVSVAATGFAWENKDTYPTLSTSPGGGDQQSGLRDGMAVRRLTPRECERLQGFADDYTLIPWRGGLAPDGPRYKALGNSMAVPVMAWIGERIAAVEADLRAIAEEAA